MRVLLPEYYEKFWQDNLSFFKKKNLEVLTVSLTDKKASFYAPDFLNDKNFFKKIDKYSPEFLKEKILSDIHWFSVLVLKNNLVDIILTGKFHQTSEVLAPVVRLLRLPDKKVSSYFILEKNKQKIVVSDPEVLIDPSSEDLAQIAEDTYFNTKHLFKTPKIAFLSFSTNNQNACPYSGKIKKAYQLFQKKYPKIPAFGDIQVDAALNKEVFLQKYPQKLTSFSPPANIFIFPDLFSANITYKFLENLGEFQALGGFVQGIEKPIINLSRSTSKQTILNFLKFL
jgi:phosphate acetyltransferase